MTRKCIYPRLAYSTKQSFDMGFMRIGGAGLANCMFVAARAYKLSKELNLPMVNPTWQKLSIGPYLRKERDKRHYCGLFYSYGLTGGAKLLALLGSAHYDEDCIGCFLEAESGVLEVNGLRNSFHDLDQNTTIEYFNRIIKRKHWDFVNKKKWDDTIGVHIRLGDYGPQLRTKLSWYKDIISGGIFDNPYQKFAIFSDGEDTEIAELLDMPNVYRQKGGNSIEDILAMSRCKMIIASKSTFSAWAAFLGNKPVIFPCSVEIPYVYEKGSNKECSISDYYEMPPNFREIIKRKP